MFLFFFFNFAKFEQGTFDFINLTYADSTSSDRFC